LLSIGFIYLLLSLIISIDIHVFFHAWTANYLGDPTAKRMGRVSLNPLAHLDPMGSLMMLISAFSGIGFGWGKPVPINPYNTRHNPVTAHGIIGVMGPISNLALAAVVAIPLRFGSLPHGVLSQFLIYLVMTNISLAVFNLIPLPPLDGYSVLLAILNGIRTSWASRLFHGFARIEAQGPMILLVVFMADALLPGISIIGTVLGPPMQFLSRLLLG
jgi:Zn-dependent protease